MSARARVQTHSELFSIRYCRHNVPMLAHVITIALAQMSALLLDAYPSITPQVAAKRVADCGVGAVTVRADTDLGADVLVVEGSEPVSDQQLACINKAASFYDVELPSSAQPRFDAIRDAVSAALMASEARKWLKAHGLLNRLPKYEPGVTDDAEFGRKVEKLCSAEGALQSQYGPHTLSPAWTTQRVGDAQREEGTLKCLLSVTWASGYKMGFIGNEQAGRDR